MTADTNPEPTPVFDGAKVKTIAPGMARDDFGGMTIMADPSISQSAAMASAVARVQARYTVARRFPRNIERVRLDLIETCKRPVFANTARFSRPVGKEKLLVEGREEWVEKYAIGLSVHFAREALRTMGNIGVEVVTLSEDYEEATMLVEALDYETGASSARPVTVKREVEKRGLRKGQKPKRVRHNSYGDEVFIVDSTDEEFDTKRWNLVAKASRQVILDLVPSDIKEEALARVLKTLEDGATADPKGQIKAVLAQFFSIGVPPESIVEALGHSVDLVQPKEIVVLRDWFNAVKNGETTWDEIVASEVEDRKMRDAKTKKAEKAVAKAEAKVEEKKPEPEKAPAQAVASESAPAIAPTEERKPLGLTNRAELLKWLASAQEDRTTAAISKRVVARRLKEASSEALSELTDDEVVATFEAVRKALAAATGAR